MEEDVEDFGALEGGAIVVEDETGGGVIDTDFYVDFRISIVSSMQD